ncbi:MAG TPA: GNAT family N-acetyltransferase [Caulobacteraceae bacterium]|jgi:hypothetical protein|nr:GNAT family N-acetyltransferase [Caulobacteraceae bacterium]
MADLIDNTQLHRFEREEDGDTAFATYRLQPGVVALTHFETPVRARGKGLAGRLMEAIVADARARGLKIAPVCSYAVDWMAKHPDVAAEIEA